MHSQLPNISSLSFVEREKKNGKYIRNKCGRDFLYYALNFYFPDKYSKEKINPVKIDSMRLFGYPVPAWLAWTQLQFVNIGKFLVNNKLSLQINNIEINGYASFIYSTLFGRLKYDTAISYIERCVDQKIAVGVDISLGIFGLLDHVMFVYGYDDENLYIIDTHKVDNLEYVPQDNQFLFKLPKSVIKKRWTRFGRVWRVGNFLL